MRSDMRQALLAAQDAGCTVIRKVGHIKVVCPNGAKITCSSSPRDMNAHRQFLRDLRRYGEVVI